MKQIVKLIQLLFLSAISSYIGYGQTNTYLAPVSIPPGYEQFNNVQGIRAIWGTPAYSDDRAVVKFSNTISNGESLYFDISITGNVYFIGLSGSPSETNIYSAPQGNPNIIFGMCVGLNSTAQAYENGNYTGPTTPLTSGNTLKISYSGSTILYQKSTDGINFTTFHTSNNVANGVYTVYFEAPPQGAGPDNLYKNGTAIIPAYAYVYKVKADSVKITNDNCNAELIIENSTKNIQGYLYNYGNGRTQFRKILQKLNDSLYMIGNDTLRITGLGSSSSKINIDSISYAGNAKGISFLNDTLRLHAADSLNPGILTLDRQRIQGQKIFQANFEPTTNSTFSSTTFSIGKIGTPTSGIAWLKLQGSTPSGIYNANGVPGTYSVALLNRSGYAGTGTGAIADITIGSSGFFLNKMTSAIITTPGTGYALGDILAVLSNQVGGATADTLATLIVNQINVTGFSAVPVTIDGIEISTGTNFAKNIKNIIIGAEAFKNYNAAAYGANQNDIVAIGYRAGMNAQGNNSDNVFIGAGAGMSSRSYGNSYVGWYAGQANKSGRNTVMGDQSLYSDSVGVDNAIFGYSSGYRWQGSNNALLGSTVGGSNFRVGNFNTMLGASILYPGSASIDLTPNNNTLIGARITTLLGQLNSNNNIIIADGAGVQRFNSDSVGNIKLNGNVSITTIDSVNTPNNMLYVTPSGKIQKAAIPSGGTTAMANNGLTKVGNDIQLGGVLTSPVTIGGGMPYTITISDTVLYTKDFYRKVNLLTPFGLRFGFGSSGDSSSVFIGWRAGDSTIVGAIQNTAIGTLAGRRLTTGSFNTFFGHRTGHNATTANDNTAFGAESLSANNTSIQHTAVGQAAANQLLSGNGTVSIGYASLNTADFAQYNTSIGMYSERAHQALVENVAIGYRARYGSGALTINDTAYNNVAIGAHSGYLNLYGDRNVFIGHSSGYNETGSDKLYIENSNSATPLIHGDFAADSLRINGKISVRDVDSVNTPQNMLYVTKEGRIMKAAVTSGGAAWSLNGNTGTNSANNFVGTIDNQKLVFRTKNLERATIDTLGNVGIGITNPQYKLDVNGTAKIESMPFLANRDTVLTYDPVTKQIKVTKVASAVPTTSSVYILNQLTATATAAGPATGLSFPVTAGIYYKFKFVLVFRTAATATGIKLGLTTPGYTVFSAKADIPIAADGAAGLFSGWLTTSGDVVTGTGVQAANTDYTAIIEGIISPTANGIVQLIFGSEIAGSQVILRPGCIINIEPYGLN